MKKVFVVLSSLFVIFLSGVMLTGGVFSCIGATWPQNHVGAAEQAQEITAQNQEVAAMLGAANKNEFLFSGSLFDDNMVYNSIDKVFNVDENKSVTITETMNITFLQPHINVGWVRAIPRVNNVVRLVGGKKYQKITYAKLDNVSLTAKDLSGEDAAIEEYFFVEKNDEYYLINSGEDGVYKSGTFEYVLKYDYILGEDFLSAFDDFTFDLLGYDYPSTVHNFSATVKMPKEFLQEGEQVEDVLSFRTNDFAPLGFEDINFDKAGFDGVTIRCEYSNIAKGHGLTMQLILPQKYFQTSYRADALYIFVCAISVLALILVPTMLYISKRRNKVVITTEFYPPKNFSPLDVARVYRGKVVPKDISSLIIWWASKGLVKFEQAGGGNFVITKLREYDLDQEADDFQKQGGEKELFDAMFEKGDTFNTGAAAGQGVKFSQAVDKIYKKPAADSVSKVLKALIFAISFLPLLCYGIWQIAMGANFYFLFLLLFPLFGMLVLFYVDSIPITFRAIWCGIFGLVPLAVFIFLAGLPVYDILILRYITPIIFLALAPLMLLVKSFTKNQLRYRGRVLGFKQFLERVELKVLERLVQDDPEYYYNILPFCYIFDLTDKLKEKFDALNVATPSYCADISPILLATVMTNSMHGFVLPRNTHFGGGYHGGGGGFHGSFGGGAGGGGMRGR